MVSHCHKHRNVPLSNDYKVVIDELRIEEPGLNVDDGQCSIVVRVLQRTGCSYEGGRVMVGQSLSLILVYLIGLLQE